MRRSVTITSKAWARSSRTAAVTLSASRTRWPRRRAGAAPPCAAVGGQRSWSDRGDRWRGGRGQIAPRLRVYALASPAGLAGPREPLGLVTQRHQPLSRNRITQEGP